MFTVSNTFLLELNIIIIIPMYTPTHHTMWPFTSPSSSNMLAAKDLKVGHRYKVPTYRRKDGLGPCETLTRKQHVADGIKYALTFHNGKERRGQYYNFTDNPVFKACRPRHTRKSNRKSNSNRKK